jgi:2-C-methyl-D-erythritol 4-phosphate cytidylyltransferase
MKIALILLTGGSGTRLSSSTPKQFLPLGGKPMYLSTLLLMLEAHSFDQIILPTSKDWIDIVKMQTASIPNLSVIVGGTTRQESSYFGLKACASSIEAVMIHDAVRPFITKKIISAHVQALQNHSALDTCTPATDTIVVRKDSMIDHIPDRAYQMYGQTPQSFHLKTLQKAHLHALKNNISHATDDCSLVLAIKEGVTIIEGDPHNFKITNSFDYEVAKLLIQQTAPLLKPAQSLEGKIFAMPGGFGDIGKAITDRLQDLGADVIPLNRQHLKDVDSIQTTFNLILDKYGLLDGLINVAGSLIIKEFQSLSTQEIKQMLFDNFEVAVFACKFAHLKEGAHILNIGSTAAKFGRKNYAIYSSSKAALINFTQALSQERKELFINALSPGRTLTKMRKKHFPTESEELLAHPSEVADQVADILSSSLSGTHIEMHLKKL